MSPATAASFPSPSPTIRSARQGSAAYISWCLLNSEKPGSSAAFWAATKRRGYGAHHRRTGRYIWPGLAMTGPAAVDYILSNRPSLV
ncbi:hypothetical protein [Pseudarthrobacter sulfonivorans]|uniref:hypothetical protein n=1 Tax=Pseudarthrobacter sulfonivorans TaxID=121292 RepID=UPI00168B5D41|nr:hypothetical protein [Pseudarthrobacter sulfonivorans]